MCSYTHRLTRVNDRLQSPVYVLCALTLERSGNGGMTERRAGKQESKGRKRKGDGPLVCKAESLRRATRCDAPLKCSKPSLLAFLSPCFSPQSLVSHALYASKVSLAVGSRWSTFPLLAELFFIFFAYMCKGIRGGVAQGPDIWS